MHESEQHRRWCRTLRATLARAGLLVPVAALGAKEVATDGEFGIKVRCDGAFVMVGVDPVVLTEGCGVDVVTVHLPFLPLSPPAASNSHHPSLPTP